MTASAAVADRGSTAGNSAAPTATGAKRVTAGDRRHRDALACSTDASGPTAAPRASDGSVMHDSHPDRPKSIAARDAEKRWSSVTGSSCGAQASHSTSGHLTA